MNKLFVAVVALGVAWAGFAVEGENWVRPELIEVRERLRAHLLRLSRETTVPFGTNGELAVIQPAAPGGYCGLWPDDWYFPVRLMPELLSKEAAQKLFLFLTAAVENAPALPDRVEPNGHLVFQPGPEGRPHGRRMPAHLPAAWIRLIAYLQDRTGDRPLVERWRGVIERSVAQLEFRDGLVWLSDTEPQVGFGFYDTVGLAGYDLLSNIVLERGLRRGVALFGGALGETCLKRANGIRENLHRLRSDAGWYLSDSVGCRQFSPWSNGLAYGADYLPSSDRQMIATAIECARTNVICRGQVRHCPDNWRRMNAMAGSGQPGVYMNGGYWAVGSAYVLSALYDRDPPAAMALLRDMLASLERSDFAEWESADGKRFGARKFMMSAALPLAAVEAILANQPLISWF